MTHPAGTIFVLRSGGFVGWAIRLLTRSRVNHAGVCIGDGSTVEAEAAGAISKGERPTGPDVIYSSGLRARINAAAPGRATRIAAEAERLRGSRYNYLDLLALAWAARRDPTSPPERPNWWQARVMRDDRLICSQLVDLACQRAGIHLFTDGRLPGQVTPGDLEAVIANPDWAIRADPR